MIKKYQKVRSALLGLFMGVVLLLYWCYFASSGPSNVPGDRLLIPEGYTGWLIVERMVKGSPELPVARNQDDPNVRDYPKGYFEYVFTAKGRGYLAIPTDHLSGRHSPDEAFFYSRNQRVAVPIRLVTEVSPEDAAYNQRLKANNQVAVWPDFGGIYSVPIEGHRWHVACDAWYVGTYKQYEMAKSKVPDAESQVRLLLSKRS